MQIDVQESDDLVVITVQGDIEMMTIKTFKQTLFDVGQNVNKDIEIDLREVDYIDSSGIGILINLLNIQKKKNKALLINKVSSKVLNVLKLSSLSDVFNL